MITFEDRDIPRDQLQADPNNPRRSLHPQRLGALSDDITRHGLLTSLLVEPLPSPSTPEGPPRFQIIDGHRRFAACDLDPLPCRVVTSELTPEARLDLQLTCSESGDPLTPLDVGLSLRERLRAANLSQAQLAERMGRSAAWISRHVRFAALTEETSPAADAIREGHVTDTTAAIKLAALPPKTQQRLLQHARATTTPITRAALDRLAQPARKASADS